MTTSHEVAGGVSSLADGKQLQFNCTSADIMVALACCTALTPLQDQMVYLLGLLKRTL